MSQLEMSFAGRPHLAMVFGLHKSDSHEGKFIEKCHEIITSTSEQRQNEMGVVSVIWDRNNRFGGARTTRRSAAVKSPSDAIQTRGHCHSFIQLSRQTGRHRSLYGIFHWNFNDWWYFTWSYATVNFNRSLYFFCNVRGVVLLKLNDRSSESFPVFHIVIKIIDMTCQKIHSVPVYTWFLTQIFLLYFIGIFC